MIPSKYLVVVVQIVTIIVTALTAANADGKLTDVEVFQIALIGVGSIGTYFVPLLKSGWAGLGKFLVAVLGAGLASVPPIIDTANGGPGWTSASILVVVLALLNAALTAWGVEVRLDDIKKTLASPALSNAAAVAVDPKGVAVVIAKPATPVPVPGPGDPAVPLVTLPDGHGQ